MMTVTGEDTCKTNKKNCFIINDRTNIIFCKSYSFNSHFNLMFPTLLKLFLCAFFLKLFIFIVVL